MQAAAATADTCGGLQEQPNACRTNVSHQEQVPSADNSNENGGNVPGTDEMGIAMEIFDDNGTIVAPVTEQQLSSRTDSNDTSNYRNVITLAELPENMFNNRKFDKDFDILNGQFPLMDMPITVLCKELHLPKSDVFKYENNFDKQSVTVIQQTRDVAAPVPPLSCPDLNVNYLCSNNNLPMTIGAMSSATLGASPLVPGTLPITFLPRNNAILPNIPLIPSTNIHVPSSLNTLQSYNVPSEAVPFNRMILPEITDDYVEQQFRSSSPVLFNPADVRHFVNARDVQFDGYKLMLSKNRNRPRGLKCKINSAGQYVGITVPPPNNYNPSRKGKHGHNRNRVPYIFDGYAFFQHETVEGELDIFFPILDRPQFVERIKQNVLTVPEQIKRTGEFLIIGMPLLLC